MGANGSDNKITQQVNLKIANRGIRTPCKVNVATRNGDVTLSGTVQFPHQKKAAVQAATGIQGVRRVNDMMTVLAPQRREAH